MKKLNKKFVFQNLGKKEIFLSFSYLYVLLDSGIGVSTIRFISHAVGLSVCWSVCASIEKTQVQDLTKTINLKVDSKS